MCKDVDYARKRTTPPEAIHRVMQAQTTAERVKRAVIATSEGKRQQEINSADGQRQAAILESEGQKQAQINKAAGEAGAVALVGEPNTHAGRALAPAMQMPRGVGAAHPPGGQQYVDALAHNPTAPHNRIIPRA